MASRSYQWDQLAARFKAHSRTRNLLCHLCVARGDAEHAEIDYAAARLSPLAFETDHKLPVSTHPHLEFVWGNLAPSHSRCNRQRRATELQSEDVEPEQLWVKPDW